MKVLTCFVLALAMIAGCNGSPTSPSLISSGGSLNPPTLLVAPSTAGQPVPVGSSGRTDATRARYSFTSTDGTPSVITELKLTVSAPNTVTAVRVAGVSTAVVNGVAHITGLTVVVPNGGAEIIDIYASYPGVGPNGVASGSTSTLALEYVKYTNSGTTKTLCTTRMGPCTDTLASPVSAPTMTLVEK